MSNSKGPRHINDLLKGPIRLTDGGAPSSVPAYEPPADSFETYAAERAAVAKQFNLPEDDDLIDELLSRNSVRETVRLMLEKQRAEREADDADLQDEEINPESLSAKMKMAMSNQIKSGEPWVEKRVDTRWVHFMHDFVDGGYLQQLSPSAVVVLLVMKVRADKGTGIVVGNQKTLAETAGFKDARQVRRLIGQLIDAGLVREVKSAGVKDSTRGAGKRYQIIERVRAYDKEGTPEDSKFLAEITFPYAGAKMKQHSDLVKNFALTGKIPDGSEVEPGPVEVTPLRSPYLDPAPQPITANVDAKQTVIQNIVVNVNAPVSGSITISPTTTQTKEKTDDSIESGLSPMKLKAALNKVKTRTRNADFIDVTATDVSENKASKKR